MAMSVDRMRRGKCVQDYGEEHGNGTGGRSLEDNDDGDDEQRKMKVIAPAAITIMAAVPRPTPHIVRLAGQVTRVDGSDGS